MLEELEIRLNSAPYLDGVEVYLGQIQGASQIAVVTKLEMETVQRGMPTSPAFRISRTEAQELFNQLWILGYRPKNGNNSAGQIEAMERHISDLRKVAFKGLKIEGDTNQ